MPRIAAIVMVCLIWSASVGAADRPSSASVLSATGNESPLSQGDVIFDNLDANGGRDFGGAPPASQLDIVYPFNSGAADDFTLPESPLGQWEITGVRWSGKYWSPNGPGPITAFNIIIWPDDGGMPAGGTPSGPPDLDQALAVFNIPGSANETETIDGNHYDYDANLPASFIADPDTTYWLEIQAVMRFSPQWGWQVTVNTQGLHPFQGFDALNIDFWTPVGDPGDLAFQLLGQARSCGDMDGDGDVDLFDYEAFLACVTGPDQGPVEPGCERADIDQDGDADLSDWGEFQIKFTG